ncbi:hypothetical protein IAQ61_002112, partial [Plenodomus lingam]|uniref:Uncharacterized protein n=1 Tax=Leptosphaeria maculans (strain JN3 / isolate v23.1.3 / race Av1-4-5-6-7-8) TaxID=985895 RepID=E4ZH50_LEPMJ
MSFQNVATSSTSHVFDIFEVLHFIHILFKAAVKFVPRLAITLLERRHIDGDKNPSLRDIRIYEFELGEKTAPYGTMPASTTPELRQAMANTSMCDHFCTFAHKGLKKHIHSFGVTVHWVLVEPRPHLWLIPTACIKESGIVSDKLPYHSVLEVRLQEGLVVLFDGTGRQFGWNSNDWIMEGYKFSEKYGNYYIELDDTVAEEEDLLNHASPYWNTVMVSLWDLLDTCLCSSELEALSPVARVHQVRKWAERRAREQIAKRCLVVWPSELLRQLCMLRAGRAFKSVHES